MNHHDPRRRSNWNSVLDGLFLAMLLLISLVPIAFSFFVQGQMVDRLETRISSALSRDIVSIPQALPKSPSVPLPRD